MIRRIIQDGAVERDRFGLAPCLMMGQRLGQKGGNAQLSLSLRLRRSDLNLPQWSVSKP
jgi:hypothetical protein